MSCISARFFYISFDYAEINSIMIDMNSGISPEDYQRYLDDKPPKQWNERLCEGGLFELLANSPKDFMLADGKMMSEVFAELK